jgi:hypothetical protein
MVQLLDLEEDAVPRVFRGHSNSSWSLDSWWQGTTREWPFMAADLSISQETLMAHYLSNHVAVACGDIFAERVALSPELGFRVRVLSRAN